MLGHRFLQLLAAACLIASSATADVSPAEVVQVGQWLEVRGALDENGLFRAEKAEILVPKKRQLLMGTVSASDAADGRLTLLGQPVQVSSATDWAGVSLESAAGQRIKVRGSYLETGEFSASEIEARDPGRDRIGGRVESLRDTDAGRVARILRFDVLLPAEVEHENSTSEIPLAPGRIESQAKDEDDLFGSGLRVARDLRLFGQVEARTAAEENFNLDRREQEDRIDSSARLRLRFEWDPAPAYRAVVEGRHRTRFRDDEKDGSSRTSETLLGETHLLVRDPFGMGLDLIVGRQDFDDSREWIYDRNLDGIRLILSRPGWRLETSASTTLTDGSARDEQSTNLIAYLQRGKRKRHFALWALHRDVDNVVSERGTHIGVRGMSDLGWLDAAVFDGRRGDLELAGWGFDIGTTRSLGSSPLSLTAAYAYGSGGEQSDRRDPTFRQTGYQDNNGRFNGVTSFRYYGELLDPELANLHIATLGLGMRIARRSSLDAVAHYYRQDDLRARLVESAIDRRPDGIHRELGWELDLILGVRSSSSWDLEAVVAYFHPGAAFPDSEDAYLGRLQLRYRF